MESHYARDGFEATEMPQLQRALKQDMNPSPKSSRKLQTPTQLKQFIQKSVIGQDSAIEAMATAIYFQQFILNVEGRHPQQAFACGPRNHLLLAGPSGCGKTLIAQTAARAAGVPSVVFDATRLTQVGYVGANPEDIIHDALAAAGGDPVLAERSVIILDEFDKLARKESGVRDISGEGVQQGLLKLIEGRMVSGPANSTAQIHTGKMLWVLSGAFTGIERQVEARLREEARGRRPAYLDETPDDDLDVEGRARRRALWKRLGTADLEAFGIIPELCSRLNAIAAVEDLDVEALLRVLNESDNSILKQRTFEFALHGVELKFTPEALRAIAETTATDGGGARALTREVNRVLGPWRYQLPDLRQRGVNQLVVTRATVTEAAEPFLKEGPPLTPSLGIDELLDSSESAPLGDQITPSKLARAQSGQSAMDLISEQLKERVGWRRVTEKVRSDFREVLRKNPCSSDGLVTVLNDMLRFQPPITIDEMRAAHGRGHTTNLQALLAFAVYSRTKDRDNPR
jgi:ATP-dependent Clp protease ATP-binding subunit ClpX